MGPSELGVGSLRERCISFDVKKHDGDDDDDGGGGDSGDGGGDGGDGGGDDTQNQLTP